LITDRVGSSKVGVEVHTLVEDANDTDSAGYRQIHDQMVRMMVDPDGREELRSFSTHQRLFSEQLYCLIQVIQVLISLLVTPLSTAVEPDVEEIYLCLGLLENPGHQAS
jgi:hypothetical protein